MSVPAINIPAPGAQPQANGAAAAAVGASASNVFSALLGQMFGDQDSLAAQIFAGATAGTKTDGKGAAEATEDPGSVDVSPQAQGLAAGFLPPAPVLVDQALTPAAANEAIDANAVTAPIVGKAADEAGEAAVPAQAQAQAQAAEAQKTPDQTPATAPPKPPPAPAAPPLLADAGDVAPAPAPPVETAAASAQAVTTQTPGPAAQAPTGAAAPVEKAPVQKTAEKADAVDAAAPVKSAAVPAPKADAGLQNGPNADSDGKPASGELTALKDAPAAERRETAATQPAPPANPLQAATPVTHAVAGVRGSPETVAHLAAQIAKHLDGKSTHFDIQLSPAGLGQVGVRVEISAHGQLTAAMSFDNPNAAAELRNRAAELTRALEQAGFDLSGGISFDVAGDQGRAGQGMAQQQDNNSGGAWRGRAFQDALTNAGDTVEAAVASALYLQRRSPTGVDIKI